MDELQLAEYLPDVQELFAIYDGRFFQATLVANGVTVHWSDRMTLCAGVCYLRPLPVRIRLSRPLLQLRPFAETVDTLLHEMIHAYLHIKRIASGRAGHGRPFVALMDAINAAIGSHITVFHGLGREVDHLRRHRWRCTGPCRLRAPFHGWVARSMRRPPQPADWWYAEHARTCDGAFQYVPQSTCPACLTTGYHDAEHLRRCRSPVLIDLSRDDEHRHVDWATSRPAIGGPGPAANSRPAIIVLDSDDDV